LRYRYRHDRISARSGIAVSPKRFQCTLYCHLYEDTIQGADVLTFLRHRLRQVCGHLIVLLDTGTIHRGEPLQERLTRTSRLHVVSFPAYAPDLNPDEGVWNHLTRALANGRPDTQAELMDVLANDIGHLGASPHRLRGCIQHAGLPFFWR
jgi:transposase